MAVIGKLRSLLWEINRRTFRRTIKAHRLTLKRAIWWEHEGWEKINHVWIFGSDCTYPNVVLDSAITYSEMERLLATYITLADQIQDLIDCGINVKIQLKSHPKFFIIGAESDEWLVQYRLMFGESSVFDDNVSVEDIRA